MPMNMPLPTKAKMTALVCKGRSRPNVVYCRFRFRSGQNNWQAMSKPALNPTRPQMTVAIAKARTMRLSYLNVSTFMSLGMIRGRKLRSTRAPRVVFGAFAEHIGTHECLGALLNHLGLTANREGTAGCTRGACAPWK